MYLDRTKRAKEWFQRYDRTFQAQQKAIPINGKGITVAVLDTGIDLQNKWISAKIGRIKCWPSRASCNDTDGHGTHVAYLLMRLAPSANIRIAKISDSQLLNDDDIIQQIAKVRYPTAKHTMATLTSPVPGNRALFFQKWRSRRHHQPLLWFPRIQ
jgi:hypothetical protein